MQGSMRRSRYVVPGYLSVRQAARLLGVSKEVLRLWMDEGAITYASLPFKAGSRFRLIRLSVTDVASFAARHGLFR